MAYFRCSVGSGGSGIPLVVTCSSGFAGLTITCSDGTTTLTDTCPSSSPYEITFNLPNTGTWTVSGTISGTTYSESVLVSEFDVELKNNVDITVDFYSAASDTVSYTGAIDGETHTITTDSSGHASATITISGNGSSITFTSSVAKDPSNLSNAYSKTIALTSATTEIYVMPEGKVFYWYGYKACNIVPAASRASGATTSISPASPTITEYTNYYHQANTSSNTGGIGYYSDTVEISDYSELHTIAKANPSADSSSICVITETVSNNYISVTTERIVYYHGTDTAFAYKSIDFSADGATGTRYVSWSTAMFKSYDRYIDVQATWLS